MSGGSSGTQQVTSTTNTSNLPDYAAPYVMDAFTQAQGLQQTGSSNPLNNPYQNATLYNGQQVAGFTPDQVATQQNVMGMQMPGQFGTATNIATTGAVNAANVVNGYNPYQFSTQTAQAPNLYNYQMSGPQQFNSGAVNQYMSPYMQDVVNTQSAEAVRNAQINNVQNNLAAAASGTYGGSNSALMNAQNNRNLQTQLANIQATGSQNAFANAQQQFNTQNALQQQTGANNLNALLQTQGLGGAENMQAQLANQSAGLQAQQYQSAANQFGSTLGLNAAQLQNQLAGTLGNLGQTQNAANLNNLQAQANIGSQEQQLNQQMLNQNYQNYLTQLQAPQQQLAFYSSILHGLPIGTNNTGATYQAAPSALSQLTGAGLGAASIAKLAG